MPITIESTPDLGVLGQAGFYAGQNNLDDRIKSDQMKQQQQQMQQQLFLAQQNQDYDLYKQLASMANQNAQLEYRTMADQVQQFNQQQHANEQQGNQQNFQAGMAQFQAGERKDAQQEEFRLREEYEKNRLQQHEEIRLKRMNEALTNLEREKLSFKLPEEDYQEVRAQIMTGISPLEQRHRRAQTAMAEMQRKNLEDSMKRQEEIYADLAKQRAENPAGSFHTDPFTGRPYMSQLDKNGIPVPVYGGDHGGSSSRRAGGAEPKPPEYKEFKVDYKEIEERAMHNAQAEAIAQAANGNVRQFVKPESKGKKIGELTVDDLTPDGAVWYTEARKAIHDENHKLRMEHEQKYQQQLNEYKQSLMSKTWEDIPQLEKMQRYGAALSDAKTQWRLEHEGQDPPLGSQEFNQEYLMPLMGQYGMKYWADQANRIPSPGQKNLGLDANGNPTPPQPTKPQVDVVAKMELAAQEAKSLNNPELDKDIQEAKNLFAKYGSIEVMQRNNPQDYQRFVQLDQKTDAAMKLAKKKSELIAEQPPPKPERQQSTMETLTDRAMDIPFTLPAIPFVGPIAATKVGRKGGDWLRRKIANDLRERMQNDPNYKPSEYDRRILEEYPPTASADAPAIVNVNKYGEPVQELQGPPDPSVLLGAKGGSAGSQIPTTPTGKPLTWAERQLGGLGRQFVRTTQHGNALRDNAGPMLVDAATYPGRLSDRLVQQRMADEAKKIRKHYESNPSLTPSALEQMMIDSYPPSGRQRAVEEADKMRAYYKKHPELVPTPPEQKFMDKYKD